MSFTNTYVWIYEWTALFCWNILASILLQYDTVIIISYFNSATFLLVIFILSIILILSLWTMKSSIVLISLLMHVSWFIWLLTKVFQLFISTSKSKSRSIIFVLWIWLNCFTSFSSSFSVTAFLINFIYLIIFISCLLLPLINLSFFAPINSLWIFNLIFIIFLFAF